jgi:ABC-type protease/lipase transport system fused ATPase/permease subunit
MNEMEARETREAEQSEEQEMAQLSKPVPNPLTRWSIILMIIGFLLFTVPLVLFPLQAAPNVIGIQNVAQLLGLPILSIGFILLLVGLMRAGRRTKG